MITTSFRLRVLAIFWHIVESAETNSTDNAEAFLKDLWAWIKNRFPKESLGAGVVSKRGFQAILKTASNHVNGCQAVEHLMAKVDKDPRTYWYT